jgi:hypothetical protein
VVLRFGSGLKIPKRDNSLFHFEFSAIVFCYQLFVLFGAERSHQMRRQTKVEKNWSLGQKLEERGDKQVKEEQRHLLK